MGPCDLQKEYVGSVKLGVNNVNKGTYWNRSRQAVYLYTKFITLFTFTLPLKDLLHITTWSTRDFWFIPAWFAFFDLHLPWFPFFDLLLPESSSLTSEGDLFNIICNHLPSMYFVTPSVSDMKLVCTFRPVLSSMVIGNSVTTIKGNYLKHRS